MTGNSPDKDNILFQLADELVNQSSRTIFLTGKAGTGKTTFLRHIRATCQKQMAVVAPTGVAAINAGGVTIHSFFQLPFTPFLPETNRLAGENDEVVSKHTLINRLRITGEKLKVIRQLELLIIDEISMVRCDTLDAIDAVLRHIRKRPFERFGGLQVLFIGDMYQLPPVIKDPEWKLLSEYYSGPYFFDSRVIREEPPVYIEFNKIYRQSEEKFIKVLNQVRNNDLDEESREILDSRFQPTLKRSKDDGYIVLTTHNERARNINSTELNQLTGKAAVYNAKINDEFPSHAFPADEALTLKPGAQVMFIKNDSEKAKRYFNGKIGTVTRLEDEKIVVQCKDDPDEIEVGPETWKNIRYTINSTTHEVDEDELGSFTQYPLRLAWAITIHKSQGLTFEKAIIDAGEAFAAGQVYVALSRCTSLEGMILQSRIRGGSLFVDKRIVDFSRSAASQSHLEEEILVGKRKYQLDSLVSTFDFKSSIDESFELKEYLEEHQSSFNEEALTWINQVIVGLQGMQATAVKFHAWLKTQLQSLIAPEENSLLKTKIKDGAVHFTKEIQAVLNLLQQSPAVTDSRLHAKEYNETVKEIFIGLSRIHFLLNDLDGNWDGAAWQARKKSFVAPSIYVNAYAAANDKKIIKSEHPQLLQQLKKVRDAICSKKDLPIYMVASSKTLEEIATYLPQTPEELQQITGFGKIKVENYGQQFLDIVQQYSLENQLTSRIAEKDQKRKRAEPKEPGEPKPTRKRSTPKLDTRAESYRLYSEGMKIPEIAGARNLTINTIEGHLVPYVQTGLIAIESLVNPAKIARIEPLLTEYDGVHLTPLKEKLGNDISYGELKLVIAWDRFQKGATIDNNDMVEGRLSE